jgi:hypothetical protein
MPAGTSSQQPNAPAQECEVALSTAVGGASAYARTAAAEGVLLPDAALPAVGAWHSISVPSMAGVLLPEGRLCPLSEDHDPPIATAELNK